MTPVVAWILILQLALGPTLVMDFTLQNSVKNFRKLNIDYPRFKKQEKVQNYCNILMSYVRGIKQSWYCPSIHYWIHAPWEAIQGVCKHSDSFCESYNEFCTFTQASFPLTVCYIATNQPVSCTYSGFLTNRRLCLLCSGKHEAKPIGIIGAF